jgi:hypothetical protein
MDLKVQNVYLIAFQLSPVIAFIFQLASHVSVDGRRVCGGYVDYLVMCPGSTSFS